MAKLLLSLGADANKVSNSTSWTPLLLCVIGKDSKATAKLLLREPSVDVLFKDAAGELSYGGCFSRWLGYDGTLGSQSIIEPWSRSIIQCILSTIPYHNNHTNNAVCTTCKFT